MHNDEPDLEEVKLNNENISNKILMIIKPDSIFNSRLIIVNARNKKYFQQRSGTRDFDYIGQLNDLETSHIGEETRQSEEIVKK